MTRNTKDIQMSHFTFLGTSVTHSIYDAVWVDRVVEDRLEVYLGAHINLMCVTLQMKRIFWAQISFNFVETGCDRNSKRRVILCHRILGSYLIFWRQEYAFENQWWLRKPISTCYSHCSAWKTCPFSFKLLDNVHIYCVYFMRGKIEWTARKSIHKMHLSQGRCLSQGRYVGKMNFSWSGIALPDDLTGCHKMRES